MNIVRVLAGLLPVIMTPMHEASEMPVKEKEVKDMRRMPPVPLWEWHDGYVLKVTDRETLLNHAMLTESFGTFVIALNEKNAIRKFGKRGYLCLK